MATTLLLYGGTFHASVGTKDTAVSLLRLQKGLAVLAFIEILAGIQCHLFFLAEPANGTGDYRTKNDVFITDGFHASILFGHHHLFDLPIFIELHLVDTSYTMIPSFIWNLAPVINDIPCIGS